MKLPPKLMKTSNLFEYKHLRSVKTELRGHGLETAQINDKLHTVLLLQERMRSPLQECMPVACKEPMTTHGRGKKLESTAERAQRMV